MQELEWARKALQDRRLPIVAERAGVSLPTVRKIMKGEGNPTAKTIKLLVSYLKSEPMA